MRRVNAVLSAVIMALFLIHGITGAFQMMGIGRSVMRALAWVFAGLTAVHAVIGIILTIQTLIAMKRSGASYWRGNQLFWARRISGFAVFALLFLHVAAFGYYEESGAYRLHWFSRTKLAVQIMLVAAIALHVLTNIKPGLIGLGIRGIRAADVIAALSVLLLIMALAFIIYYLRWNVF